MRQEFSLTGNTDWNKVCWDNTQVQRRSRRIIAAVFTITSHVAVSTNSGWEKSTKTQNSLGKVEGHLVFNTYTTTFRFLRTARVEQCWNADIFFYFPCLVSDRTFQHDIICGEINWSFKTFETKNAMRSIIFSWLCLHYMTLNTVSIF